MGEGIGHHWLLAIGQAKLDQPGRAAGHGEVMAGDGNVLLAAAHGVAGDQDRQLGSDLLATEELAAPESARRKADLWEAS
jgi:hypothetical protein